MDYGIVLLLDAGKTVAFNTLVNRGLIYLGRGHHYFALEVNLNLLDFLCSLLKIVNKFFLLPNGNINEQ